MGGEGIAEAVGVHHCQLIHHTGAAPEAAEAGRAQQPSLGGKDNEIDMEVGRLRPDRPHRLGPIDGHDCLRVMRPLRDGRHRQHLAGRFEDVGKANKSGTGGDAGFESAQEIRGLLSGDRKLHEVDSDVSKEAGRPGVGADPIGQQNGAVAGSPRDRQRRDDETVGGARGQRDALEIRGQNGGQRCASLGDPRQRLVRIRRMGPAEGPLARGLFGHGPNGLGRERTRGRGIQVDPGTDGWERLADRREPLAVGRERGDHDRMIPTMPRHPAAHPRR
jgi:hypothetical protein